MDILHWMVLISVVSLYLADSTGIGTYIPPGHNLPLGDHMNPIYVDVSDNQLGPLEFFDNYVKPSKPVLLKGAAKTFPSFNNWRNDTYLKKKYGDWKIMAEKGKKETRKGDVVEMSYSEFLNSYNHSDLYLVADIKPEDLLSEEVFLPRCLLCGGFANDVITSVMWFSSGGTKSVLHFDDLENINCLYDGVKELVLFDKKYADMIPIDHEEGTYSSVDVEKVDMYKYPTLGKVPWYKAKMEAGDCFYIPYHWHHQVNSWKSRNLAINLWWTYSPFLRQRHECPDQSSSLDNHRSLSTIKLATEVDEIRSQILGLFNASSESILYEKVINEIQNQFHLSVNSKIFRRISNLIKTFDLNKDSILTIEELYTVENKHLFSLIKMIALLSEKFNQRKSKSTDAPPGHLLPLGSHMSPESIEELTEWPTPIEFFEKYQKPGKPVVFRGLAKSFPSFDIFQNDTRLKLDYGEWKVQAEEGKKENRSKDVYDISFGQFLDTYEFSDIYLVDDIHPRNKLAENVFLPRSLLCGGFLDLLNTVVMWFSSGSTKSVLHNDGFENINCLYDGTKKLVIIDKKHKPLVPIDNMDGGYSNVDIERVDMYKYPTLAELPWYNVTINAGDCLYIPLKWYHQVNSMPSRNLAINIWWFHLHRFRSESCPDDLSSLADFGKLSDYSFAPMEEQPRSLMLEMFGNESGATTFDQLLKKDSIFEGREKVLKEFFDFADANGDSILTYAEIEVLPLSAFEVFKLPAAAPDMEQPRDEL